MKALSWASTPSLQPPRRDPDKFPIGCTTGPTTSLYVGTHAVFQLSNVVPHTVHSKLFTSRDGAMDSVRRYTEPHLQCRCWSVMGADIRQFACVHYWTKAKNSAHQLQKANSRASPWRRRSVATCSGGSTSNDKRAATERDFCEHYINRVSRSSCCDPELSHDARLICRSVATSTKYYTITVNFGAELGAVSTAPSVSNVRKPVFLVVSSLFFGKADNKFVFWLGNQRQVEPAPLTGYAYGTADRNKEPSFILARRNTGTFAFGSCSWA